MKLKTTKKQIKNNFNNIYSFGYCQIQNLVYYKNAFAYSSGSYGWGCDYYEMDNVCLSTGYSPTGIDVNSDLVRKYEDKAKKQGYSSRNSFSFNKMTELLKQHWNKYIPEFASMQTFQLPKLNKIELPKLQLPKLNKI